MEKLLIKLPVIYNLTDAHSNAKNAFDNSVQVFRDMLYMIFISEGINLPEELNQLDNYFTMHSLQKPYGKEFFLTTGEVQGKTRFKCIIRESTEMICSVQVCEKSVNGQLNIPWKDVLYKLEYFPVSEFETHLPKIIESMKTGELY